MVFISYSQKDLDAALNLCRNLESKGFGCWIAARNIPAGVQWETAINH